MKLKFKYNGEEFILKYNNETGVLEYVLDPNCGKKMLIEYTQVGEGYEFTHNNGFVDMDMCNAVYVRIMHLDVFVPKYIFIPNIKEEKY